MSIHGEEDNEEDDQPVHHPCSACHNHAQGHTVGLKYSWEGDDHPPPTPNELMGLILKDSTPADETIIITSKEGIIITDDEIKKIRANKKEDNTTRMNSMSSI